MFTLGLTLLLLLGSRAFGQTLPVAGDGENLWIVKPEAEDRFVILHRHMADAGNAIRRITSSTVQMRGQLAPGGIAAGRDGLWLVYQGMAVQSVQAYPPSNAGPNVRRLWTYGISVEPILPEGVALRSFTAGGGDVWALLRVETPAALEQIDTGQRPTRQAQPNEQAAPGVAEPAAVREDRLVQLERNRWGKFDLPEDWPVDARAWVVAPGNIGQVPWLVTLTPADGEAGAVLVWRRFDAQANAWQSQQYNVPSAPLAVVAVEGQLVIAQPVGDGENLELALSVLRSGRVVSLGTLGVDARATDRWALLPFGQTATLVAVDQEGRHHWARMDLRGQVVGQPAVFEEQLAQPIPQARELMFQVAILVLATLIMYAFWRRDPNWNRVELPRSMALADLSARAAAALIDLLPCIGIAAYFTDVRFGQVLQVWPGIGGGLEHYKFFGLAIGLFVLHTTLGELFTARSIGKAVLRLHVANLNGLPPNVWQVLGRNMFKVFDLLAPPLLVLPIIGPFRQRLGDMVSRTLVVVGAPESDHVEDRTSRDADDAEDDK